MWTAHMWTAHEEGTTLDALFHYDALWLWVPAFAGTTIKGYK
jgi:hypothetical protein